MRRIVASVTRAAVLACAAVGTVTGCASATIEGGVLVARDAEPVGVPIGEWRVGECRDAHGGPLPDGDVHVSVLRKIDGKVVLIERRDSAGRAGRDSVVVDNASRAPGRWVFTLALARASGNLDLRAYTVPEGGDADGQLVIARKWERRETRDGFAGTYTEATVTCPLVRAPRAA